MGTSDDVDDDDDAEYDEAEDGDDSDVFEIETAESWETDAEDYAAGDEAPTPAEDRDDELPW